MSNNSRFSTLLLLSVNLFLFIISSSASEAEDATSGNFVFNGCAALADYKKLEMQDVGRFYACAGAISATNDLLIKFGVLCPPEDSTLQQAVRVVYKYMELHPERLSEHASRIFTTALMQVWACKGK